jgi:hypothetical protein
MMMSTAAVGSEDGTTIQDDDDDDDDNDDNDGSNNSKGSRCDSSSRPLFSPGDKILVEVISFGPMVKHLHFLARISSVGRSVGRSFHPC